MEPSLEQIDDYNGKESKSKKRTVYLVVGGLIVLGILFDAIISNSYHKKPEIYTPTIEINK